MNAVTVRSPSRVDLAGGTLDLWPLYAIAGGATTVNLAIGVWTEATIEEGKGLVCRSKDLGKEWSFADHDELWHAKSPQLGLFRHVLSHFPKIRDCSITTSSQGPVGGGIGGSSSLTISLLKALHQWLGIKLPPVHDLVHWAHNIEARMLRTPTGTQDYYPAASGGLNIIDYGDRTTVCSVQSIAGTPLQSHFLVVNTGRSHHSGLNNFDVLSRVVKGEEKVIAALNEIRRVASEMRNAIVSRSWEQIPNLFREETQARLQLTPLFSSPEIDRLASCVMSEGAEAYKICGAGGGGCVLVWVKPGDREKVVSVCQKNGFQVLDAAPVEPIPHA